MRRRESFSRTDELKPDSHTKQSGLSVAKNDLSSSVCGTIPMRSGAQHTIAQDPASFLSILNTPKLSLYSALFGNIAFPGKFRQSLPYPSLPPSLTFYFVSFDLLLLPFRFQARHVRAARHRPAGLWEDDLLPGDAGLSHGGRPQGGRRKPRPGQRRVQASEDSLFLLHISPASF